MVAAPLSDLSNSLMGCQCSVEKREADWIFRFGEHSYIAVSVPWRIVTSDGIAHGDEDDGQWFGLLQPVDGEARANELLRERPVVGVDVDELTADLRISFDGGTRLDLFNHSSGYEGWEACLSRSGTQGLTIIALGGGGLATFSG